MDEREQIFRERLVAYVAGIKDNVGRDLRVRKLLGAYANRMSRDAGARNWADLKARADLPTYDSMLNMFQRLGAEAEKQGDTRTVRALEALGLSLIARTQTQPDLLPGVTTLDRYIAGSEVMAQRMGSQFIPVRRSAP